MTVLLFSGGLDSTVLLYELLDQGDDVAALTFHYGQRHSREVTHAARIAHDLGIAHEVLVLPQGCFVGSALTGGADTVVVPNRNMVFVAMATAWAVGHGHDAVAIGATGDDHDTWPDCRSEFFDLLGSAVSYANDVTLMAPYTRLTKAEVVAVGRRLGVPMDATWSCYAGADEPCGTCPACVGRTAALA